MKSWLNNLLRQVRAPMKPPTLDRRLRPCVELLEDRLVPATVPIFTVTTASDAVVHTGVSLRDAVIAANTNGDPGTTDLIQFAPGLSGQSIKLQQGVLNITQSVRIAGRGANHLAIDGGGNGLIGGEGGSQIFDLVDGGEGGVSFTVQNLTLTHGNFQGPFNPFRGGGAIGTNNNASSSDQIVVQSCVLTRNVSSGVGGAIGDIGASLLLQDSVLSNNSAALGGGGVSGLYLASGETFEIDRTLFSANEVGQFGSGLLLAFSNATALVDRSAFLGNIAFNTSGMGSSGGAIGVFQAGLIVQNSTIAGNLAASGAGGIVVQQAGLFLRNDTITHNHVAQQGSGGVFVVGPAETLIQNSILEGNFQGQTASDLGFTGSGNNTPLLDVEYSLVQAPQPGAIPNTKAQHDIVGVPAQLVAFTYQAPLASYTLYALASTSPARKSGNRAFAVGLSTDEIGNPRTQTSKGVVYIDMGAIESTLDLHRLHF